MDFRDYLILIYLNTVNEMFTYHDLVQLLGLPPTKVTQRIEALLNHQIINRNESNVFCLTEEGIASLEELGFENIKLDQLYKEENLLSDKIKERLPFEDVFVPKRFDKKFKGYKELGIPLDVG